MELVLTGNLITAQEAERIGLISKVFTPETLLEESMKTAHLISSYSQPVVMMAKEAVNKCYFVNTSNVIIKCRCHCSFSFFPFSYLVNLIKNQLTFCLQKKYLQCFF